MVPAVAVNVALLDAAGTKILAGTVRTCALLKSVTVDPPEPAAWDKVRVHVDAAPELRLAGAQDNEVKVGPPEPAAIEASNCTGGSPLTFAITLVTAPITPFPIVKMMEARPRL